MAQRTWTDNSPLLELFSSGGDLWLISGSVGADEVDHGSSTMARDKIAAIARILRRRHDPTRYVEPFYIANSTRRTRHGHGAGVSIRVWRDMDALAVCVADQRPGGTDAGDPGGDGFCWECCRPGPEDGHAYVF